MGVYHSNQQWTTYRVLDATILNADVAAGAAIDFTKLGPTGALTVGASGAGYDVTLYGDNAGSDFLWDQNGDSNIGLLSLGATGGSKGVEFIVYGATNGNSLQWDQSADDLLLVGTATQLAVAGTTDSSNPTSGSLRTAGGLGVAMAANIGTTLGIAGLITSTSVTGFRSNPTFIPDATRTNYALAVGTRATAKDLSMAASADYNLDPIQVNLNIIGTAPTSSTVNLSYMNITHTFANMAGLRLKCSDWNIVVAKNIQDAYVYQGELDFTGNSAVGGEACVMGMQVNASAGTVTGDICGVRVVMGGASLPSTTSKGVDISSRNAGTLTDGLYFYTQAATTMTNAIYVENEGTLTNVIKFSAVIANTVSVTSEAPLVDISATANAGYIRCMVGSDVRYIPLYAAKNS